MPVSPPPDRILRDFLAIYRQAELELTRALATAVERGAATEDLSRQLVEATRLRQRTESILARLVRAVGLAVPKMLLEAVLLGGRAAVADLDQLVGPRGRDYDADLNRGAVDGLARSLFDTLTPAHLSITRTVDDVYKAVIGRSVVGVLVGTATRREASQKALDEFAARGVTSFTDRAGRRWQMDTYAEMAARAATARATVDAHVDRLTAEDIDLGYISDSPQECPLCRPWEGKVVALDGAVSGPTTVTVEHAIYDQDIQVEVAGSLVEARAAGLFHPNCTHSVSAYLPGVTKLPTNTENPQGYEDKQHLRYLERGVRAARRRQAAAFTPEARTRADRLVTRWDQRIQEHVADTQAKRQPARERPMDGRPERAQEPEVPPTYVRADTPQPAPQRELELSAPRALEAAQPEPEPAAEPVKKSLRKVTDAQLGERMADALAADDFDEFDRLSEEEQRRADERTARREQREADRAAKEQAQGELFDRLLSQGVDEETAVEEAYGITVEQQRRTAAIAELRRESYKGKGFDELSRASWKDRVLTAYADAEDATNGYMLTNEARRLDIDPLTLFTGPESRVRKYASPELREWFDQNGRLTLEEHRADLLGDGQAARRMRAERGDYFT